MKTALYCKWQQQQSLSSFIEETCIEFSVSSVQSTLEITEMLKTRVIAIHCGTQPQLKSCN